MKRTPAVLLLAAMLASAPVAAQTRQALPDDATIDAERARIETARKSLFGAGAVHAAPGRAASPSIPTPPAGDDDVEAIAERYRAAAQRLPAADGLLVFASLSMPASSLRKLIADTVRAGGSVVLRGFKDGSFKATATVIHQLSGAAGAASVQINPEAFVKYRVESVPTVALLRADTDEKLDADGCALPDAYASVAGDVGLDFALTEIEKRAPRFRDLARRYGEPLRGGPR